MRILLAFAPHIQEILKHNTLADTGHDILFYDWNIRQIPWNPKMNWQEILAVCPAGWVPDIYIHWSIEYNPIPHGIEDAACYTVGVLGDWNLGGRALEISRNLFDGLVADMPGCELLQRMGHSSVTHGYLWAYDPEVHRLSNPVNSANRDIDVLMIGNFNPRIQQKRNQLLYQVAGLSESYNIQIVSGVFGAEYVKLMNRARIVFNMSVRGEANMRSYESAACGALTFNEEGNRELESISIPDEHYIAYNRDNLEDLLERYLSKSWESRRIEIAENGRKNVIPHTYEAHMRLLLEEVEKQAMQWYEQESENHSRRKPCTIEYLTQWLLTPFPEVWKSALQTIQKSPPSHDVRCLKSVAEGLLAVTQTINEDYSSRNVPELLNRAWSLKSTHQYEGAIKVLTYAQSLLDETNLKGLILPLQYSFFDIQSDIVWQNAPVDSFEWKQNMTVVLKARLQALLAECFSLSGNYEKTVELAIQSLELFPDNSDLMILAARSLLFVGRLDDAVDMYRRLYTINPMDIGAQLEFARVLIDSRRYREGDRLLTELTTKGSSISSFQPFMPEIEMLHKAAKQHLSNDTASIALTRCLFLPDWSNTADWMPTLKQYVTHIQREDPMVLILYSHPDGMDTRMVLGNVKRYLECEIQISPNRFPHITALNHRYDGDERWKLIAQADVLLTTPSLSERDKSLAQNLKRTLLSQDEIAHLHSKDGE